MDRDEPVRRLIEIGVKDADGLIDPYEQKGVFQDLETGKIGVEEFCRYLRKHTGKDLSYEDICWAWFGFIGGVPQYKLDYILKLREKYQVYLLSNTNQIHWDWTCIHLFPYRTFKVEDYFEKTYLSFEMKMAKPEPEIFKAIIEDAGIEPQETLFIDDSEMNCKAAQNLGISTYTAKEGEDWSHLFNSK